MSDLLDSISVKAGMMSGEKKEYTFERGVTVAEVLEAAELEGPVVYVNRVKVEDLDAEVPEKADIVVMPEIKGG